MLKRALCLTLCLLLCFLPVRAEDTAYQMVHQALYRLVLRTPEGDIPLGSAVLFVEDDILLTALGCCAEGEMVAIGRDGEHNVLTWDASGRAGAALIQLAEPSDCVPLSLSRYDAPVMGMLLGTDAQGNTVGMPLRQLQTSVQRGQSALLFAAEEGLLPGAVLADELGQVVSIVVAQQAEGRGMYTGLDADALYAAIVGEEDAAAFLPLEAQWQSGTLTITWTDENDRTEGLYLMTISGESNSYYTSYEAEPTQRSLTLTVPPGQTYSFQVQWTPSAQEAVAPVWSAMTVFSVPAGEYTANDFSQTCCLLSLPEGQTPSADAQATTFFSVDTLSDPALQHVLQATARYSAPDQAELPMTLTLVAPDGQFYYDELRWQFQAGQDVEDPFTLPMDDLLETCARFSGGQLQPGAYTLSYAIGGLTAGEYAFTVQPAGTPDPHAAPAASGLLHGVTALYHDGVITVDWDNAAVPQGATVSAYLRMGDNPYYTYYGITEGAQTVDFAVVPGLECMVWVGWSMTGAGQGPTPRTARECAVLTAEEKGAFTLNGFTHRSGGLTLTDDPNAARGTAFLPWQPITADALKQPGTRLIFQTEDTYRADVEPSEHTLVFALTTPEGWVFSARGVYSFLPEYAPSDLWLRDLSDLTESYAAFAGENAWPAGQYTFGYYIDGLTAAEYIFTLE